jgi:hypothetical protein
MQGRGGNRPGPFDGFPDPFANFGFGMMGGGRGGVGGGGGGAGFGSQGGMRSLFDVFDNDPFFSDPFFTRPFGGSFGSFLGSRGGLGHPFFGLPQPAFEPRQALYLHNQPHNPQGVCDPFLFCKVFCFFCCARRSGGVSCLFGEKFSQASQEFYQFLVERSVSSVSRLEGSWL